MPYINVYPHQCMHMKSFKNYSMLLKFRPFMFICNNFLSLRFLKVYVRACLKKVIKVVFLQGTEQLIMYELNV